MDAVRIVRLLFLALPLFLADCERGELSAKDIDDIREAVFRHQFEHNASGQQSHTGAYCIGFGERDLDPSSGFLARFAGMSPPVLKSTACGIDAARRQLVVTATGQPALRFSCANIHRRWDDSVDAAGGYYEANLSASGNVYRLKKVSGSWVVVADELKWIS
jgi:hypothetical protein